MVSFAPSNGSRQVWCGLLSALWSANWAGGNQSVYNVFLYFGLKSRPYGFHGKRSKEKRVTFAPFVPDKLPRRAWDDLREPTALYFPYDLGS